MRRLDWAKLLKRVFAVDVLECARCGSAISLVAFIDDEPRARKILLDHLGLSSRAPPRGRQRRGQQLLPMPHALVRGEYRDRTNLLLPEEDRCDMQRIDLQHCIACLAVAIGAQSNA